MNSFSTLRLLVIIDVLILLFVSLLWAQSSHIYIEKIASTSPPQNFAKGEKTGGKVIFKRGENGWQDAYPNLELLEGDYLETKPFMHVRIRITRGDDKRKITLQPDDWSIGGIFRFENRKNELEPIQIYDEKGAISIDGSGDPMKINREGIDAIIRGTKVTFMTDPDSNKSIVFLEEGSAYFPINNDTVKAGEIWVLDSLKGPYKQKLSLEEMAIKAARLKGIIEFNTEYPWAKPFPWYIPAGAALIGGGAYLITRDGKEDSTLPGPPNLP